MASTDCKPFAKAETSLGVVFFPAFDWAITPTHPEREERLLYTRDQLLEEGLFDIPGITEYRPEMTTFQAIERVHFCPPGTPRVTTASHLASAGGAITAARLVLEGREQKAFALVRPPGHHSMRVVHGNRGFCNINNEAIMIAWIRDHYAHPDGRPLRIAIVDTDVHHADGSQDVFWNDPDTLFISLHQDGRTLYPGTGFMNENGGPAALGKTVNIPLPPGTSDEGYLYVLENAVLPILDDFKPDLVINSAGQDNHFTDPLANEQLSAQGYAALNARLSPDIAVLEGGYSIRGALPYVNMGICLALAGLPATDIREPAWTPAATRQSAQVASYIERLVPQVLDGWRSPPKQPTEGRNIDGWWTRKKYIYYDTDGIQETQNERWRLCDNCAGLGMIETSSSVAPLSLCLLVPRSACPACRRLADEQADLGARSGRFSRILRIDEDASPVSTKAPWPLESRKAWL